MRKDQVLAGLGVLIFACVYQVWERRIKIDPIKIEYKPIRRR